MRTASTEIIDDGAHALRRVQHQVDIAVDHRIDHMGLAFVDLVYFMRADARIDERARRLLTARGNEAYTAGWVAGAGPSAYVVAAHILHLHLGRRPSRDSSGRFLVEGQLRTELVRDLRLRSDASQAVLRALARMLSKPRSTSFSSA